MPQVKFWDGTRYVPILGYPRELHAEPSQSSMEQGADNTWTN